MTQSELRAAAERMADHISARDYSWTPRGKELVDAIMSLFEPTQPAELRCKFCRGFGKHGGLTCSFCNGSGKAQPAEPAAEKSPGRVLHEMAHGINSWDGTNQGTKEDFERLAEKFTSYVLRREGVEQLRNDLANTKACWDCSNELLVAATAKVQQVEAERDTLKSTVMWSTDYAGWKIVSIDESSHSLLLDSKTGDRRRVWPWPSMHDDLMEAREKLAALKSAYTATENTLNESLKEIVLLKSAALPVNDTTTDGPHRYMAVGISACHNSSRSIVAPNELFKEGVNLMKERGANIISEPLICPNCREYVKDCECAIKPPTCRDCDGRELKVGDDVVCVMFHTTPSNVTVTPGTLGYITTFIDGHPFVSFVKCGDYFPGDIFRRIDPPKEQPYSVWGGDKNSVSTKGRVEAKPQATSSMFPPHYDPLKEQQLPQDNNWTRELRCPKCSGIAKGQPAVSDALPLTAGSDFRPLDKPPLVPWSSPADVPSCDRKIWLRNINHQERGNYLIEQWCEKGTNYNQVLCNVTWQSLFNNYEWAPSPAGPWKCCGKVGA